ncbi:hypothetical protein CPC08DRAFT_651222 [Agrocybe pediades]|nr:hypothetical protein CPC08DRAFT_651222 [Agrocybe pediades]
MKWFYSTSSTKSIGDLDRLVNDVILAEDFNREHLTNFSARWELDRLDSEDPTKSPFATENGWKESSVNLSLPTENVVRISESDAPTLTVPKVYHRSLVSTIISAFQDESANRFHYSPFRLFWKRPPTSIPERVISELYNSDAFIAEHDNISKLPPAPGPPMESAIAAMMLWSDSTHLANFGDASLWPLYLFFGNQSKYSRSKPSSFAAHHVAYIPSLPKDFQDQYMKVFSRSAASADTITHLKRDLMHAVWDLLLDAEFMEAYQNGIVITCADGVTRRIFPRIFTYSADYPEKILLATIRPLGRCPCPRCLIEKRRIDGLGTKADDQRRAHLRVDTAQRRGKVENSRRWIYKHGRAVKSKKVEENLFEESYVPTRNAFSVFSRFGVNFFTMFVPDLLHEFELGVWKAIFTHLMRILYACGDTSIQLLNRRCVKAFMYCFIYVIHLSLLLNLADIDESLHLAEAPFAAFPEMLLRCQSLPRETSKIFCR